MRYELCTQNMNNSLVFYRSLFDKMPDVLEATTMKFYNPQFELSIHECNQPLKNEEPFFFEINTFQVLEKVHHRMKRFKAKARFIGDCEKLTTSFGLTDFDGYRWVIGKDRRESNDEKCYITEDNI